MVKARYIAFVLFAAMVMPSCEKNTVSKIPQIGLMASTSAITVNIDTCFIEFSIVDGDGDIGSSNNSDTSSVIYYKDSRFDSAGFTYTQFPPIDESIEDPKKGITGTCTYYPIPEPVPRDSLHGVTGDTLTYEIYITDRAGHQSNHIITHPIIIRPL